MKLRFFVLLTLLSGATLPATSAAQAQAEVVEARPFYVSGTTTEQREVCESRSGLRGRSGQILGGVAGGFAGSAIGSGRGRDIATVAGALAGSELGRRHIDGSRRDCRVVPVSVPSEEVGGYDVIYRQDGRLWRTRRSEHPGSHIQVPAKARSRP